MSDKRRRRRQNSEGSEHSESDEKESKDGVEEVDLDKDEGVVSWLLLSGRSFWVSAPPGSHLGKNVLIFSYLTATIYTDQALLGPLRTKQLLNNSPPAL